MDIEQMMIQYQERCPRINELNDSQRERIHKIIGSVEETVGLDYLVDCVADGVSAGGDGVLRCYVGFEPSGKAHIGWKVLSLQLKRMLEADVNVLVFPWLFHGFMLKPLVFEGFESSEMKPLKYRYFLLAIIEKYGLTR